MSTKKTSIEIPATTVMNKLPADRTVVKKIVMTRAMVKEWKAPPFQRPLSHNKRLEEFSKQLVTDATIDAPIHLGFWEGETYIIDGQHRTEGFLASGLARVRGFVTIKDYPAGDVGRREMAEDYIRLSRDIVKLRPDDTLRALESTNQYLKVIRNSCPFIGYDQIRRNTTSSAVLSMNVVVRAWHGSANEIPSTPKHSAYDNARHLTVEDCNHLEQFLMLAFEAWGREFCNRRLWSALNLTLCMWLYRRVVMPATRSLSRCTRLTPKQFLSGLRGLSGSSNYVDWLTGRSLHERERSPAYGRLRSIFVTVLNEEMKQRVLMPSPTWYSGRGNI